MIARKLSAIFVLGLICSVALAADLKFEKVEISGVFKDDEDAPAVNLSGLSCLPAAPSGERTCLAIDDEGQEAQVFSYKDKKVVVREVRIPLIDERAIKRVIGKSPNDIHTCGSTKAPKFEELDGEAVAYAEPYFYVVGSHGCGRTKKRYKPSAFILVRYKTTEAGVPIGADANKLLDQIEMTSRLAELLGQTEPLAKYFKHNLSDNGLNIEGMVVHDGEVIVGMRAPNIDGKVHLIGVKADALFVESATLTPRKIEVPVGAGVGIRDMAPLSGGRILILTGPSKDGDTALFKLHRINADGTDFTELGSVDQAGAKAEGITLISESAGTAQVLVFYEDISTGGARLYTVPLTPLKQ